MKKNVVLTSLVIGSIIATSNTSCSSKRKVKKEAITYTLSDISTDGETPDWVFDDSLIGNGDKNNQDYKYFVGEDDNINKTLCTKGASANATEKVVEELSQEIKSNYTKIINNDNDNLDSKINATIQHNIESKLGGIERVKSYWEQRNYQQKLGADKDKKVYFCYQVVKIKKSTMKEISDSVTNATLRANNKQ